MLTLLERETPLVMIIRAWRGAAEVVGGALVFLTIRWNTVVISNRITE